MESATINMKQARALYRRDWTIQVDVTAKNAEGVNVTIGRKRQKLTNAPSFRQFVRGSHFQTFIVAGNKLRQTGKLARIVAVAR